jgi:hypothetical protein
MNCPFYPHPAHPGVKCSQCKCKGKPGLWAKFLDSLGNVIGNNKFGGD